MSYLSDNQEMVNAMTVDVEDYFQVSAFESTIGRSQWDSIPCRIEKNVEKILALFSSADIKATFFVLGWIAERYPRVVTKIADQGHEIASHGYGHQRIVTQTPSVFREDLLRSKAVLEDLVDQPVIGYRAPSYSIGESTLWAHDILAESGFKYSSSVVPVKHDLYGIPNGDRFPYLTAEGRLLEIPISTVRFFGKNINCGGGGWFRLFPYHFTQWAISSINRKEMRPSVFYFHPWEIDPNQPRVKSASAKSKFRHYVNLSKTSNRLKCLLSDFQWSTMQNVYLNSRMYSEVESPIMEASKCH
ncbi:MAG: XrtA system polysaccharide deacetylase [Cellvibrionaceae bacterium]